MPHPAFLPRHFSLCQEIAMPLGSQSSLKVRLFILLAGLLLAPALAVAADEEGYQSLFDGKSLTGWDGNPEFWRVEDGTITGQTTAEKPTKGNTFIVWRGGDLGDFELKLQYKIIGGNSGIQYRSFEVPGSRWVVGGYQADFDASRGYAGSIYGEKFRGMLASRGQKTVIGADHKPSVAGSVGDPKELQGQIKEEDWNDYEVSARGFQFTQKINGVLMAEMADDDTAQRRASGILALQLHAGPPMKVQFRNIQLKKLPAAMNAAQTGAGAKKIAFVAGKPSHGYGAHEHKAGCLLLARALNESGLPVRAEVYTGGWPADPSVLNDAATIICYSDGGKNHPFNDHIPELNQLTNKGTGMVCIHYAVEVPVEVPAGRPGDALLNWIGGYFEANWSINPHWDADYAKLPNHPISRGVRPFSINDEWYYHMRFRAGLEGVTPILTTLPPTSTLSRPDGPHSNNPIVREEIKNGVPQHMAWACQRTDGGRGFGFTGGHFHWNWGHDEFRKLVLNAIAWSAKVDVSEGGVPSRSLTVTDLMANQDEQVPPAFKPEAIQAMLDQWNKK
jgi:hypothetical protein